MFPNKHDLPALTESESEKYMTCTDAAEVLHPMYGRWFLSAVRGGTVQSFMLGGKRCIRKEAFREWCDELQYIMDHPPPWIQQMLDDLRQSIPKHAEEKAAQGQGSTDASPMVSPVSGASTSPAAEEQNGPPEVVEGPAKTPVEYGPDDYITYQEALQGPGVTPRALSTAIRYTVLKTKMDGCRKLILKSSYKRWFQLGGPKAPWMKRLYKSGPPKLPKPKAEASPPQPTANPQPPAAPSNPLWIYKE